MLLSFATVLGILISVLMSFTWVLKAIILRKKNKGQKRTERVNENERQLLVLPIEVRSGRLPLYAGITQRSMGKEKGLY